MTTNKPSARSKTYCDSMRQAAELWKIPVAIQRAAKAAGCPAFAGQRVHREPLLTWLGAHPEIEQAVAAGERDRADLAALKIRRLAAQVATLRTQVGRESGTLVSKASIVAEYAQATAIFQEEARALLPADDYRTWCVRCKERIGSLEP